MQAFVAIRKTNVNANQYYLHFTNFNYKFIFFLECNKPLGMHSGAISRNDISASHWRVTFNDISKAGTNLIKLQPKSCAASLSSPYFLEIRFRQVTIITGYHLNHGSNSMNYEGHYYGYSYTNGNTADFQFILSTRQLLVSENFTHQ